MTAGTMNLASLYMGNSQTDGEQTSSFTQTGGTVNILGGACRFGVRGDATYTIGGGETLASLLLIQWQPYPMYQVTHQVLLICLMVLHLIAFTKTPRLPLIVMHSFM